MGVAILSGVVASLESLPNLSNGFPSPTLTKSVAQHQVPKWEHHTSGTSTPVGAPDASLPSRFIACVSREESVQKLMRTFHGKGGLSENIEIVAGENLASVQEADVVLLWCAYSTTIVLTRTECHKVASLNLLTPSCQSPA